jgi:hypothetical protein
LDCKDLNSHFKDFIEASRNNADGKEYRNKAGFIQIGTLFSVIIYHINNLETMIKLIIEYMNNANKEKKNLAKFGPSSMLKINQKINNQNKKNNTNFIGSNDWKKLSSFEKYQKSFRFSDFTQNIPVGWWKTFTKEQKEKVLNDQLNWRKKRQVELAEGHKKEPDKFLKYIDTYMFYQKRDKFGMFIRVDAELEKNLNLKKMMK